MIREIIFKGTKELLPNWGMIDPGTSPYWWTNTPSKKLNEVWNAGTAAAPIAGNYAYIPPNSGNNNVHGMGFGLGPTLARFTKVKIETAWDRSAGGGSDPFFFADSGNGCTHGPIAAITLRKRDLTTWLTGTGDATYTMTSSDGYYTNIYTSGPYVSLKTLTWEMTAHPEGGPWLLEDISNLGVGITTDWSLATSGPDAGYPFRRDHRAFHKLRFPYLTVTLTVEDLGGYVNNVRATSSYELRLMRRARNVLTPHTFIDQAPVGIGERVYMTHPKGPSINGEGWGSRPLERRAGLVLARTYDPESFKCSDEVFDLRPYACLGWAAYRIDAPWNPELQGLSLIDKGRGFTHTRAQDAWSPRPGDNVLYRVLEDYPNLSFHGLAIQGGDDTSVCLRNYDCAQTGWSTVSSTGDFSAAGAKAGGTLTYTGIPIANNVVVVGDITYKFVATVAAAYDVKIGTKNQSANNLVRCINKSGGTEGAGQDYIATAANTKCTAAVNTTTKIITITSIITGDAGNAYVFTKTVPSYTIFPTDGSLGGGEPAGETTPMVEEQGYLSSAFLSYGAGGATGGRERSLGALGAGRLHVRVVVKNNAISNAAEQNGEWYLRKGTDYWNNTTRTWTTATPAYNAIPSDKPYGEIIADSIPCAATTYHIGVGRFSSAMGPATLNAAVVDVQHTDTTVAGARTPLITLDAVITREPDTHKMDQVYERELWVPERGTAVIEVQPFWRAEDLVADDVKPLLHAQHTTDYWDALQFVPGTPDNIRFERAVASEATFQLDCPMTVSLTRAHVLRAWARWLGADGWNKFGAYSIQVGYAVFLESDGSLVETNSVLGQLPTTTDLTGLQQWNMAYTRDYLGIGCDETRYLDGYVRMWETRRNPLDELEAIWKI